MAEWFERFFGGLCGHVLRNTWTEEQNAAQALLIKRLLRLRRGHAALDVPCGLGRISIPLARLGVNVTGVDFMETYLRSARRTASKLSFPCRFVKSDMREIDFRGEFDAVINWFTSFGYFDERGDEEFSRRIYRALKPGGKFLIEVVNRPALLRRFRPCAEESVAGVSIKHRRRFHKETGRLVECCTLSKGERKEQHRLLLRLYTAAELGKLLRRVGFERVDFFGNPPLQPYSQSAKRMIAVGYKARR